MKIPFYKPSLDEREEVAVVKCIRSGWLTTGAICEAFEKNFTDYLGADVFACAVNSATAGLHLALDALNLQSGDEVIVPTMTFTASAEVIRYVGATPVFADISSVDLNVSLETLVAKVTPATRAVILVHFAGLPVDLDEIIEFCKSNEIVIIEDAAHALGAVYKNEKIGTHDNAATIFSFYANKNITTGEGGMLVTRDASIYKKALIARSHGIDRSTFNRYRNSNNLDYDVIYPGFKYNLTDIAASLGIVQLQKCDTLLNKRAKLVRTYEQELNSGYVKLYPSVNHVKRSAFHLMPVWISGGHRDRVQTKLNEAGIVTSIHYKPLHMMSYWSQFCTGSEFPNAEKYYSGALSLPLYPDMTQDEQQYVISKFNEIIGEL